MTFVGDRRTLPRARVESAARRTIHEQTGKLKSPMEGGVDALVRPIRGDLGMENEDG